MKILGNAYVLLLTVGFLLLPAHESRAQLFPVTPHDLLPEEKVVVEGQDVPQWKSIWDAARKNALQGDFDTAVRQYRALLVQKNDLEEARWELARLMMYLKRWQESAELLELLIEADPERALYVNALGKVMWEMAQYERAAGLFMRVYEKNPSDQIALAGLVECFVKLGRKIEALPYLEQFIRQEPTNRGVRRYLAFLYFEEPNYDMARVHFTILSRNEDVELDVLRKTAKTYERLGLEQQASWYWERLLAREPGNIDAHVYLANYYENAGRLDSALAHLQAILEHKPDDGASFERLGKMYEKAGEFDKALASYGKYLEKFPADPEVARRVASISSAMDSARQSSASRVQHLPADTKEETASLKKIIRQYESTGRHRDAIPLYRQLIGLAPEDPDLLTDLTRELLIAKERAGESSMVQYLSDIVPDNVSVYRAMAEVLRKMERQEELLSVLQKIHALDPGDHATTRELAIQYLQRGELALSSKYFAELPDADCRGLQCLQARATLAEMLKRPAHALNDYETLLNEQPELYDVRLRVISLAAGLGLLDTAVYHAGYLQNMPQAIESLELKMILADVYREAGYFSSAEERYRTILEQAPAQEDARITGLRTRAWLGITDLYRQLGLVYEAEQALRTALASEKDPEVILEELFHLALETGRIQEGEIWLQAAMHEIEQRQPGMSPLSDLQWKKEFLQAEMYSAAGDQYLALELCAQAESFLPAQGEGNMPVQDNSGRESPRYRVRLQMAKSLLLAGNFSEAEGVARALQETSDDLELHVLLERIYRAAGKDGMAQEEASESRKYAAEDLGRQLDLARLYRRHGDISQQLETAEQAAAQRPESFSAKHLLVEAMINSGAHQEALALLRQLLGNYPENTWFLSRQVELIAKTNNFQEAVAVADMILAENRDRRDVLLLKARLLWEMNRWQDSAALYESVAVPATEDILRQELSELAFTVGPGPAQSSWWEVITFSEGDKLSLSEIVMSPQHATDFSEIGQAVNSVAARQYALYRWQERFARELSVRRSVLRREYYHAANKLENLISAYGSNDFLLYDLAGLYSKLERLGDEAVVYQELEKENEDFPGLAEAIQRNNLKRSPHVSAAYMMRNDDGWDGYMAVKQETFKAGGWYWQSVQQNWSLDLGRIDYAATDNSQEIFGWRTMLTYDARISHALGLTLAGGMEKLENDYGNTPILYGAVTGKVADEMRAVFSYNQDVVTDTIAALKRNIRQQDYKIEVMFDLFPRLLLGGYYDFIDYSDANWTSSYAFWASYILLPEPNLLKISYNYDFYDSREGRKPGEPTDDGFALYDHPYWSPINYWITRFSFYFKHQLSNDALARGVPSYYTIEYSLGYDTEDNDYHELKGSLNIEIARNYTLSLSYGYLDQDVYDHEEALMAIMYRW